MAMDAWTFNSRGPEETHALGRALGRAIGADGLAIALVGPLGAGKTVFVKGLAEGLGVDPRVVSSPTFVIAQQYRVPSGPEALHHVDLYRLESEDELEAIGFFDMFALGSVVAVEWADRFPEVLGREYLEITLEGPSAASDSGDELGEAESLRPGRGAKVRASGEQAQAVLADWAGRSEAGDTAGGSTGQGVQMRLIATLWVAFGLLLGGGLGSLDSQSRTPSESCAVQRSVEGDRLGTLRVECVSRVNDLAGRAEETDGIARLLEGRRIDLNEVSADLLETLPGIGPARARAILVARPFVSLADLERVPGIGPKTRAHLERWLEVMPETANSRFANKGANRDG